jgi:hypothetical protein
MRAPLSTAALLLCGACAGSTDVSATARVFTGSYSVQVVESTISTSLLGGGTFPCTNTSTMSGTVAMTVDTVGGVMSGSAQVDVKQVEIAHSTGDSCKAKGNLDTKWSPRLTGTTADLRFAAQTDVPRTPGSSYIVTSKTSFAGALSNNIVTGTSHSASRRAASSRRHQSLRTIP